MLKYIHTIRMGASRVKTLEWRDYDIQFRLIKEANPSMSFSIVDKEIWLLYMCSSFTNTQILSQQTSLLKCYDFNYMEHVANTSTNTNMNVLCVKI